MSPGSFVKKRGERGSQILSLSPVHRPIFPTIFPLKQNLGELELDEVYMNQHLSLNESWKAYGGKPRSEPDLGKLTVRDRRGDLVNAGQGGNRRPLQNRKSGNGNSLPKVLCAQFYPD